MKLKNTIIFLIIGVTLIFLGKIDNIKILNTDITCNDTVNYELDSVLDKKGQTIFYYCNIKMFPCINDKCEIMDIKMYWDIFGNYYKIELPENKNLSKLNHKKFSDKEYFKLHNILLDTTSDFHFLKLEDLTEKQAENSFYETDAISGATIKHRDFECINGAVKTTYQLWHIANGNISKKIIRKKAIMRYKRNTNDILEFNIFLKDLESNISENKLRIKKLTKEVSFSQEEKALLFYNFLIRNNIKGERKYKKNYKKKYLNNIK